MNLCAGMLNESSTKRWRGYSFQIGTLDLHPLALSVDLGDVVVQQQAHQDPPLISIHEVVIDARFAPLLKGKAKGEIYLNERRT